MKNIELVSITTDIWPVRRRSVLGVTAYWIHPETLKLISKAIACRLRARCRIQRISMHHEICRIEYPHITVKPKFHYQIYFPNRMKKFCKFTSLLVHAMGRPLFDF